MSARSATAPVVSRTLRAAGFIPSQPSRACPQPSLQVQRSWSDWTSRSVVSVRHTRVNAVAVTSVLRAAGYVVQVDRGEGPWTYLHVSSKEE